MIISQKFKRKESLKSVNGLWDCDVCVWWWSWREELVVADRRKLMVLRLPIAALKASNTWNFTNCYRLSLDMRD